jgi:hypothetical protein
MAITIPNIYVAIHRVVGIKYGNLYEHTDIALLVLQILIDYQIEERKVN